MAKNQTIPNPEDENARRDQNRNKDHTQDTNGSRRNRKHDTKEEPKFGRDTNDGTANPLTERSKDYKPNGVSLWEAWGKANVFKKIRDVGMLSKMPAEEVFFRNEEGKLRHSDYMIHMWNKVKNIQTGMKAAGKSLEMLGDAFGGYERGRSLR